MHPSIPIYIAVIFGLTTLLTIYLFYRATKSKTFLIISISWLLVQSLLGLSGLYQNMDAIPPRIILFGLLPSTLFIFGMLLSKKGRTWMDTVDLKGLTYFHSIRIPVEIVLSLLYYHGVVSILMTFEGTNFDIVSGLSAPIVAYFIFREQKFSSNALLVWNIMCLLLLLNVVITAIFSFPTPFQRFAFDQPNIGVLYFPFNLLPTLVVPTVLLGHIIAIRQLTTKKNQAN